MDVLQNFSVASGTQALSPDPQPIEPLSIKLLFPSGSKPVWFFISWVSSLGKCAQWGSAEFEFLLNSCKMQTLNLMLQYQISPKNLNGLTTTLRYTRRQKLNSWFQFWWRHRVLDYHREKIPTPIRLWSDTLTPSIFIRVINAVDFKTLILEVRARVIDFNNAYNAIAGPRTALSRISSYQRRRVQRHQKSYRWDKSALRMIKTKTFSKRDGPTNIFYPDWWLRSPMGSVGAILFFFFFQIHWYILVPKIAVKDL